MIGIRLRANGFLPFFSHLELESLPTGGWGYDHFPLSAKYVAGLGLDYLGMAETQKDAKVLAKKL